MTDPRNIAHDKRVQQTKRHRGAAHGPATDEMHRPGRKPHQQPLAGDHGPDADEALDPLESTEEP